MLPFEKYLRQGSIAGLEVVDGAVSFNDDHLEGLLRAHSPFRTLANVVRVGSGGYKKLVTNGGWLSDPTPPTFHEVTPNFGELYANPAATQAMLDDIAFGVQGWLANEIAMEFAKAEGAAFINGNGINRPLGFLTASASSTSDSSRPFGVLQHTTTDLKNLKDKLVELLHTLRAPYRTGAAWIMNSATLNIVRKLKTDDGTFLWQAGLSAGQRDTLLGYPVVLIEDMPDMTPDSSPIAFGNFKAGYLIAERHETHVLRDPYSNKPYVHFYATKRVGGNVANSEAIKLLKVSK